MLAGLLPSEVVREDLFQAFLLASGGLLAVFSVPWLVAAKRQSLHGIFMCICLSLYLAFFL